MRGVGAWFQVGRADSRPVAKTQTDDAGHFLFYRVDAEVQMIVSSYQDMVVAGYLDMISGYKEVAFIPGTGDMFFEIELKR